MDFFVIDLLRIDNRWTYGLILEEESDGVSKFVHDPEEIAAFFQSQSVVFVQFLQENYLNTIRTIEEATEASDILSLADVLNSEWRVSFSKFLFQLRKIFVFILFMLRAGSQFGQSCIIILHSRLDAGERETCNSLESSKKTAGRSL